MLKEKEYFINELTIQGMSYRHIQEKLGIYSSSIHLSRTFEYMQRAVVSLRKEIMNLASISMFIITHLLEIHSHDLRKCN